MKYVYWRWGFNSLLRQDVFGLVRAATQDIYRVQARLSTYTFPIPEVSSIKGPTRYYGLCGVPGDEYVAGWPLLALGPFIHALYTTVTILDPRGNLMLTSNHPTSPPNPRPNPLVKFPRHIEPNIDTISTKSDQPPLSPQQSSYPKI